jgi:hypothetical protein
MTEWEEQMAGKVLSGIVVLITGILLLGGIVAVCNGGGSCHAANNPITGRPDHQVCSTDFESDHGPP